MLRLMLSLSCVYHALTENYIGYNRYNRQHTHSNESVSSIPIVVHIVGDCRCVACATNAMNHCLSNLLMIRLTHTIHTKDTIKRKKERIA